jgi:carbonic anhydrase
VRNTIRWIQANSPTLASMALSGDIAIVGAMYDVRTGKVEFLDGVMPEVDESAGGRRPVRASPSLV